jgi:hypothetical protein
VRVISDQDVFVAVNTAKGTLTGIASHDDVFRSGSNGGWYLRGWVGSSSSGTITVWLNGKIITPGPATLDPQWASQHMKILKNGD